MTEQPRPIAPASAPASGSASAAEAHDSPPAAPRRRFGLFRRKSPVAPPVDAATADAVSVKASSGDPARAASGDPVTATAGAPAGSASIRPGTTTKDDKPVEPKDGRPAEPKDDKPAEPKDGKPAEPKDGGIKSDKSDSSDPLKTAAEPRPRKALPTARPPGAPPDPWTVFARTQDQQPGRLRRGLRATLRAFIHEYALLLYTACLLAVAMTWPALRYPMHTLPQDLGDPSRQAWQVSWIGHILVTDPVRLWQANAYFPAADGLAFGDSLVGYALAGMIGTGPAAAVLRYNVLFVLAHALLVIGAYALVRQLGARRTGAAVAAVAFSYAPWRLAQEGHLDIISAGGIPLALAMLARGHGYSLRHGFRADRRSALWAIGGWIVAIWQLTLGFSLGVPFAYVLGLLLIALMIASSLHALRGFLRYRREKKDRREVAVLTAPVPAPSEVAVAQPVPVPGGKNETPPGGQTETSPGGKNDTSPGGKNDTSTPGGKDKAATPTTAKKGETAALAAPAPGRTQEPAAVIAAGPRKKDETAVQQATAPGTTNAAPATATPDTTNAAAPPATATPDTTNAATATTAPGTTNAAAAPAAAAGTTDVAVSSGAAPGKKDEKAAGTKSVPTAARGEKGKPAAPGGKDTAIQPAVELPRTDVLESPPRKQSWLRFFRRPVRVQRKPRWNPLVGVLLTNVNILGATIFAATAILIAVPYIRLDDSGSRLDEIRFFSPPVQSLLIGPAESRIWGAAHETPRSTLGWAAEMSLLPGFVLYALALAGLFLSIWRLRHRLVLVAGLAVAIVFTLGTTFFDGRWTYLPLFGHFPASFDLRIPGRLMLWVTLLLAILAAGAVDDFVRRAEHLAAQRIPPWPGPWLRLTTLIPLVLVTLEGWNTTAHPIVPAQPAAMRTVPGPMLVLPTAELTDQTVQLWSTTKFQDIANGGGGFGAAAQNELRTKVAGFPDATSIDYLDSIGVRRVLLLSDHVAGTSWEDAGDLPVDNLDIRREDVPGAVIFYLD
ncbi:hypothetical protein [Actinoplanes sp. CA-252034]|uniref:hypothetical protein n=1 Tax=Actinoplanes sp. CA-252034 TaxID=3239906 RepID=UPI003D99961E